MRKSPSIFIFLLVVITQLKAQSTNLDYYKNTNLAELAICDSNFETANTFFQKAFAINSNKSFSKDLLNAFFAAMDTKKYPLAEKYFSKLLARGLGKVYLQNKILKFYQGEDLQEIHRLLKKYPNDTFSSRPLANSIHKMMDWDRGVRLYYTKLNDGAYMTDSTYTVDSINAARLLQLFKKNGVQNEVTLGNQLNDFDIAPSIGYDIIILHHNAGAYGGKPSHLLDTFLYEAVLNFDFELHSFAFLLNESPKSDSVKLRNTTISFPLFVNGFFYDNKTYVEYLDEASEKIINDQRAKLGMESLDDFRKKMEARNIGTNQGSVLSKYFFVGNIRVLDGATLSDLGKWLSQHSKDSPHKRAIADLKSPKSYKQDFGFGVLGKYYLIGKSEFDSFVQDYQRINKEYYQGQVVFSNWKHRSPPLPWNYHAEVIANPNENLKTDSGRFNRARFVPGYKMLIESACDIWSVGYFRNIEMLFDNNKLMQFSARTDTTFYKAINRKIAPPTSIKITYDTVSCSYGSEFKIILSSKTYVWKKANVKMEFVTKEEINEKCVKKREAIFYMTDEPKYQTYFKKVAEKKASLEKENK